MTILLEELRALHIPDMYNIFTLQIQNSTGSYNMTGIDPNIIQLGIFLITIAFVWVTWKKMSDSNTITKQALEITQKDAEARLRPWVSIYDFGPDKITLTDGSILDYHLWAHDRTQYLSPPSSVRITLKIKNSGPLPAKNFKHKSIFDENEITREILSKEEFSPFLRVLMPGEETGLNIDLPWADFKKEITNKLWIAGKIEYEINENKKCDVGLIGYLFNGGAMKRDTWSDDVSTIPVVAASIKQSCKDDKKFQKWLAWLAIWSGANVTLGATVFTIGASMWVAAWSLFPALKDKENEAFVLGLINFFNNLSPLFMIIGIIIVVTAYLIPFFLLNRKF